MLKRWLGRIRGPFLYLVVVGLLTVGAYNGLLLLRSGLESYQPLQLDVEPVQSLTNPDGASSTAKPGTADPARPGTTAPLSNRVVVVVVNGLGLDDVESLPAFQAEAFKNISTGANLFTGPVQPTSPALVTLLTGASTELTGGFRLDGSSDATTAPDPRLQLQYFDNLFEASHRSRFTTALFGTQSWYEALPPGQADFFATFDNRQPSTDIADNALNFLQKKSANFVLIQLPALGQAQTEFGLNAPQSIEARQNLNTALARLVGDEIDLRRTTLIITGDWDNSVRAGDRYTVPLVLVGQAVQPGEKTWGRQEDLTSTVAALLGVEIPRHNQGRLLSNLLSMPAVDQGEKFLALAEQRQALATAYRNRLGLLQPLAVNDPAAVEAEKNVKLAQQNYRLGSYDGIEGVIDPVLRTARTDMEEARQEWFAQVRWQRAILAVVLVALPLVVLLFWRSALGWIAAATALVATTLPYGLYWLQGKSFAFNSTSFRSLLETSLWRAGLSLLVALLIPVFLFDWAEKRRKRRRGRIDLDYQQIADLRRPPFPLNRLSIFAALLLAWLVYFGAFVWLVWYYWRFGYVAPLLSQPPVLPDTSANFLQFFALNHLLGFALMMVPAPLLLVVLYWFKRKLRGDSSDAQEEQDILQRPRPGAEAGIVKLG